MASKKEVTIEDKLRALYDLQLIDSRVDEIRSVRGELPLEVEDLEDDVEEHGQGSLGVANGETSDTSDSDESDEEDSGDESDVSEDDERTASIWKRNMLDTASR